MSAVVTPLTVEEFLQLPDKPGVKRELVEGVVVERPGAAAGHEIVKSNIAEYLVGHNLAARVGKVFSETMFLLGGAGAYIPDVAFLLPGGLAKQDRARQFQCAPDLAVEVVSSESASDLETKVRAYLRGGSHAVWVVYPEHRGVRTFHADGIARWLEGDQVLEEPSLLPGFAVKVSQLFEGI
jgi:Uma2 family endonuclease